MLGICSQEEHLPSCEPGLALWKLSYGINWATVGRAVMAKAEMMEKAECTAIMAMQMPSIRIDLYGLSIPTVGIGFVDLVRYLKMNTG